MRLRRLVLRILTDAGPYGTTIDFPDGLVVLWADNSMGKSTALRSILWALGFEAMLTTSQSDVPLPPVMKAQVETDGPTASVTESEVLLEIENSNAERLVIQRGVTGARDVHLITVVFGPALTKPDHSLRSQDFFVSRPRAATSDLGFHQMLAGFLGWDLPEVQTFDSRSCPLYLQCIFPYLIVEQTRGWSSLQPQVPTHFRIRDVHKRVVELLLRLDAHEIAAKRQRLQVEDASLRSDWATLLKEAAVVANGVNGSVQGLPGNPTASWPPKIEPQLMIPREDEWIRIQGAIQQDVTTLESLVQEEIPRVNEVTSSVTQELAEAERRLRERTAILARLFDALENERKEGQAVQTRLRALDEDLRRNKDVQILQSLGSKSVNPLVATECPTCHQQLKDTLTPLSVDHAVMSIEDNIKFVSEQRRTFSAVLANSQRMIAAREQQVAALRHEVTELRTTIRSLRQTLVADGRLPSIEAIRTRLQLEDAIRRNVSASEEFVLLMKQFESAAERWKTIREALASLPREDASATDRAKVDRLSDLFRQQLVQFGFASLKPSEVSISPDSYRPEHDGFDLPSNISASDFIRVIWAYLNGLLELSRTSATSHPGLLVFDEPGQQSMRDLSFKELLTRVSSAGEVGQQVIFATSENRDTLKRNLEGLDHHYIEFEGRVITKQA